MGLFERFPYTNFHDLNLTWILNELKTLEHTINEFVSINALKYADPIQWNITTQYEKNTIVIDPLTGTAYISVQPVPSGVALTNTDYWTVVFDLGSFVVKAAKNFCSKYEEATTLTATFPSSVNDWLIWGDTLYYALVNITAGDSYVVDSNIKQFTVEDVVGHIQDLNTTDKSNLVAAINEVLQTLADTAGDLDSLNTTDKSNLVAAINEVLSATITNQLWISPEMYGAIGDGVTDDSAALQNMFDAARDDNKSVLLTPGKTYLFKNVVVHSNTYVEGAGATLLKDASDSHGLLLTNSATEAETAYTGNSNIYLHDIIFDGNNFDQQTDALLSLMHNSNIVIDSCSFKNYHNNHMIELNSSKNVYLVNCKVSDNLATGALVNDITRCAINIDYATSSGYPGMNVGSYDNTPCDNIFVDGCNFDQVMCAVDSHGAYYDNGFLRHSNIHVNNIKVDNSKSVINLRLCQRVWISDIKATNISMDGSSPWGIAIRGSFFVYLDSISFMYCGNANTAYPVYIADDTVDGHTQRAVAITIRNYCDISEDFYNTVYIKECTGLKMQTVDIYKTRATDAMNIDTNCYDTAITNLSLRGNANNNAIAVGAGSTIIIEGFVTQNFNSLFSAAGIIYATNGRVNTKTWSTSGSGDIIPQNVREFTELFNSPIMAGHRSVGSVAAGATSVLTMTPTSMTGSNAEIVATFESSSTDSPDVSVSVQNKTASSFDLVITNHGSAAVSGRIDWIMMNPQLY